MQGGQLAGNESGAFANDMLAELWQSYISEVAALSKLADELRTAGKSAEEIVKILHVKRNALKARYYKLLPADLREKIKQHNLRKYGNELGPSIEQLRTTE